MADDDKLKTRKQGLLLGSSGLVLFLLILLPARWLGAASFSQEEWFFAVFATLAVKGGLGALLLVGGASLERFDRHFLHLPILSTSLLLDLYLFFFPELRSTILMTWIIVLLFGSMQAGFRVAMAWSLFKLAGYLVVLSWLVPSLEDFSPAEEALRVWFFFFFCIGTAVILGRLRRRLDRALAWQRKSEASSRNSEARLRQVIDLVPHFIYAVDREGRWMLANRAVAEAFGRQPAELLGKSETELRGQGATRGSLVEPTALEAIGTGGERMESEIRFRDAAGRIRLLECTMIPFVPASSDRPSLLGVAIDVTEARVAEDNRRQLEAQMQHLQKLESLGLLAGGIAHDFNNLLVSILGFADLAFGRLEVGHPARSNLEKVVGSAERAAVLVKQLLAYSGQGQFVVETFRVSRLLEEVGELIAVSLSKKANLVLREVGDPAFVRADRAQLHQVVMNLVTNASDALEGRPGTITLTTGSMFADRVYLDQCFGGEEVEAGDFAFLEIADDGCGMDEPTRAKIFDPFFTTKFVGRGLGLAAVLGIVRSHKGALKVESALGRGTRIRLLLPLVEPVEEVAEESAENTQELSVPSLESGALLLVDDDPTVREFVREVLADLELRCMEARNGAEAVEIYGRENEEISLVLLDMRMPMMNGDEVFRELRRIRSDVRVILMSGYSEQHATSSFGEKGPVGFLQKPFSPEGLVQKLQAVS